MMDQFPLASTTALRPPVAYIVTFGSAVPEMVNDSAAVGEAGVTPLITGGAGSVLSKTTPGALTGLNVNTASRPSRSLMEPPLRLIPVMVTGPSPAGVIAKIMVVVPLMPELFTT